MSKTAEAGQVKLRKGLRSWDVFFLSVTGMVGSGWLFAAFGALPYAGPASIFSWIVAGAFFFVIGICFAELGGLLPFTGALVRYNHYSHGALSNFLLGWAYVLGAATTVPLEAVAILTYLHSYIPGVYNSSLEVLTPLGIVVALTLMLLFMLIQYVGVNVYGTVNSAITIWKLAVPVLTAILLLTMAFHPSNFGLKGGLLPFGPASIFAALVPSGIVFAVEGFRQGLEYSGEAKNPQRDVPLGLVMAMAVVIVLYVFLQIAMIGAIDWGNQNLAPGDWAGLANSPWKASPFYSALKASSQPILVAFATVILIDAAISPAATLGVYIGTTARALYGFSRLKYFPKVFGNLHPRFQTPSFSLIIAFLLAAVFLLPFPSWYSLVGLSASFTVYDYLAAGITNHVLWRVAPNLKRPFDPKIRLPTYLVGFLVGSFIVYWSGWSIVNPMFIAVAAGLPLFVLGYGQKLSLKKAELAAFTAIYWASLGIIAAADFLGLVPFPYYWGAYSLLLVLSVLYLYTKTFSAEIRAGSWIVAYNIVVGVLSYYGSLGTGQIPYPYDYLLFAALNIPIYGLAVGLGFKTQEIREIEEKGLPSE